VSFEGSVVNVRDSLANAYYGRKAALVDILVKHAATSRHGEALRAAVRGAASK
jgi:hypothetical protein